MATALAIAVGLGACRKDQDTHDWSKPHYPQRMLIIGVDGMDPELVEQYMAEGKLPHLQALSERGGYMHLATSTPPQSPVAWSTFTTGAGSDYHGIYDFIHRNPKTLSPYLSTSSAEAPEHILTLGKLALPLSSAKVELLRKGRAFWEILGEHGIPATVVQIPANFPPRSRGGAEVMSGMGTPDLLGTYGTFQILTDVAEVVAADPPTSGMVHALSFSDSQRATTTLIGPPDPLSAVGKSLTLPVEVIRDVRHKTALIRLGDAEVILEEGAWSDWVPVHFDPGLLSSTISGMVRIHVRSLSPHTFIYVSPIDIDPSAPEMPISTPEDYSVGLAKEAGRFYTDGMPEDTKALASDMLSEDEFLAQKQILMGEKVRMLNRELSRFDGGVLFFYLSVDLVSHMYWRTLAPDRPPELDAYADVIPKMYQQMDGIIGDAIAKVGDDTAVIVMSDHGFGPFTRKVHLNTWLAQSGYLSVLPPDQMGKGALGRIDWERTQAYALGFNQLFINVRGREAHGAVAAADRELVMDRIERGLLALRDPKTGARVVSRVFRPDHSAFPDRAPDLLVGYTLGYRSSDESALGQVGDVVFEDNTDKWSGDHCIDPQWVPGVLFSSVAVTKDNPSLVDLAPTVLTYFGLTPPSEMIGKPLFSTEPAHE
ncbi:MAG TPA: alkaline phosphatase family protein [Kofleriaceae bacterium]|nr:alkaline phosphatase family protein [Kofleriaceae bacterium]